MLEDKQIIKVDSLDELYITQLQAQLKRKEQECEELKEEVKKQKEIAEEYEQRWLNSYGV